MISFPAEPLVRVGLCENMPFGLHPNGPYSIDASDSMINYTPLNDDAYMFVKGLQIGRKFHWQRDCDLKYAGIIQVRKGQGTSLLNIIKAEKYLECVVGSEMHPAAPQEFIKAHAVISRSWLLRLLSTPNSKRSSYGHYLANRLISWTEADVHSGFDVCPDDHCQRYQGLDARTSASKEAIKSTRGMVLIDENQNIADTRYSKCCGGVTELFSTCWGDMNFSYLQSVEDPYCSTERLKASLEKYPYLLKDYDAATSDYYEWERRVPALLIEQNLKHIYSKDIGHIISLVPLKRGPSGRIFELQITGTSGSVIIGKELAIRRVLSDTHLYSSAFKVSKEGEEFVLKGRGWGHGVGLCQIGAAVMAAEGAGYEEILAHYFPQTQLSVIY